MDDGAGRAACRASDPLALKSLSVQFRGMGVPEQEIVITCKPREDGSVDTEAVQDGNKLVRRGRAVVRSAGS